MLGLVLIAAATLVDTPVLSHPVERGALLVAGDFELRPVADTIAETALDPRGAAGLEAVHWMPAGAVVRSADLAPPRLVRRGEPVTIALRASGISITTPGRALADGRAGERVRVLATATQHTLEAVVDGPAAVRLDDAS